MTAASDSVRGRGALLGVGCLALLLAWVVPTSTLQGGQSDPALLLDQGVWVWRASWTAWGLFLIACSRGLNPGPQPTHALFAGGADRALLAVLLLGIVVRVIGLDGPLWFDEAWMWTDWLSLPFGRLVRTFGSDNNHPLYTISSWLSVATFGDEPWAMRLPAALFGVGSVWAVYVLGRDRVGRRAALFAALGLALAYQLVAFSQDARGYTGLLFFSLVSTHAFLDALDTGRTRSWVLHGLFLGLAVFTHLTGAFIAVGHVGVWLLRRRGEGFDDGARAGLRGLFLGVLTGICLHALILPQVVVFFLFRPADTAKADSQWNDPAWFVGEIARNLHLPAAVAWIGVGVGVLCGVAAVVVLWRRRPELALLVVLPSVLLGGVLIGLDRNLWPRMFVFEAGFCALAGAALLFAAVDGCSRRFGGENPARLTMRLSKSVTAVFVVVLLLLLPRTLALPKQDYPGARDDVLSRVTPGEPIATVGLARYPYQHYYRAPFTPLDDVDDFAALFPAEQSGYVLNAFPVFVQSRSPRLWQALQSRTTEVARFRGSKGGGDVVVLRVRAVKP